MAEIKVNTSDVIMLSAMTKMRKIVKADAKNKHKEIAINEVFWRCMKVLDAMEGGK